MVQFKVKVSRLEINVEQVGHGQQVVLCLPGALGFIDHDFGPLASLFDHEKFTVVMWDPPGFGKSRPPDRDFRKGAEYFSRDATWAFELMRTLGYAQFSVLGWSDGAMTACILAADYAKAIKKVVIWGGNAFITDEDLESYQEFSDIDTWPDELTDKQKFITMYGEEYFRKAFDDLNNLYIEIYNDGGDICKDKLPEIKCQTLIIHGAEDGAVPYSHADYFKKNIAFSELRVIPDARHDLHLQFPDIFISIVQPFLDS